MPLVEAPKGQHVVSVVVPVGGDFSGLLKSLRDFDEPEISSSDLEVVLVFPDYGTLRHWSTLFSGSPRPAFRVECVVETNGTTPGRLRNCGLDWARGRWVTFADADDFFDLGLIRHLAMSASEGADVLAGEVRVATYDGDLVRVEPLPVGVASTGLIDLVQETVGIWRFMFSRDFLQRKHIRFPDLAYAEDLLFMADVVLAKPRVSMAERHWYTYRLGVPGQLTAQPLDPSQIAPVVARLTELANHHSNVRTVLLQWKWRVYLRLLRVSPMRVTMRTLIREASNGHLTQGGLSNLRALRYPLIRLRNCGLRIGKGPPLY